MEQVEEHYCVRWKGFHSNIVTALEDLKTDEEFVDVTLSCDGRTIQGHKVILSACSPYFKKILKDNPCRHPVLILNDIQLDVLEALMTYMYNGTVSVPQNKLQVFLKTAEALKIKGIVDTESEKEREEQSSRNPSGSDPGSVHLSPVPGQQVVPLTQPEPVLLPLPPLQQHVPGVPAAAAPISGNMQHHPAGDLSLLASAAVESSKHLHQTNGLQVPLLVPVQGGNAKRRKTAPRKLGSYIINSNHMQEREEFSPDNIQQEDENNVDTEKENKNSSFMTNFRIAPKLEHNEKGDFPSFNGSLVSNNYNTEHNTVAMMLSNQSKVAAMNLSTNKSVENSRASSPFEHEHSIILKQEHDREEGSLDLSVKTSPQSPGSLDSPPGSGINASHFPLLTAAMLPVSMAGGQNGGLSVGGGGQGPPQLSLLSIDGNSPADQMAALLGPEQMAALLGPSWKSRQPRMCQYCQRMFSNKFNLKQHILNMHTVGRELMCEICQKKVKNKWYLRRHHVTHHGAPLKK